MKLTWETHSKSAVSVRTQEHRTATGVRRVRMRTVMGRRGSGEVKGE